MLRERVIGGRGDAAEVVPEFEAESDESEEIGGDGEEGHFRAAGRLLRVRRIARRPEREAEAGDEQEVRAEALIEEKGACGRRLLEQAEGSDAEEEIADGAQEHAKCAEADPDESGAFDGKCQGDGIVFQADGNGEGEKTDSQEGVEQARQCGGVRRRWEGWRT